MPRLISASPPDERVTTSAPAVDLLEELYDVITPFNRRGVELRPETRFVDDLELDSLTVMEVVAEVEDRFDVTLPLNLLPDILTIEDLARCITRLRGGSDA